VGAVIEEVSRLAASALSDEALLQKRVFAAETDENKKGVLSVALDEPALASAVEALVEMVESSLDAHANAWRYPPALAGRAYARLLDTAFDPLDEGALADDADETLAALSGPGGVGECLGVDASARHAMLAWALARRYREASVGDGLFGGKDGADAETPARRAYARAVDAEAEAERDDDDDDVSGNVSGNVQTRFVVSGTRSSRDPYALLSAATRVLCAFKEAFDEETSSRLKEDDVALVLTHAALGPVSWWTEGALCDFYKDVDVVAAELARRLPRGPPVNGVPVKRGDPSSPPAITAMGFERVLGLGVAAADARARVAAATAPGFDGDAAAVGVAAGRALAARACALSADEAYARLKGAARAHDVETARARGELGRAEAGTEAAMDAAPGARVLADGCAALADAFEAHLAPRVASAAGPAAANAAPASLAERFGADLSAWLAQVPPLDAGALAALAAARDFQNAVAAAVADRAGGAVGAVGDGVDVVRRVDESFSKGVSRSLSRDVTLESESGEACLYEANALTRAFEPFRLELRIAPAVFAWVAGRVATMRRATMRAARAETWRGVAASPGSSASHGAALSAVELIRSAWDTLEAFWALDVPAPAAAMRALTEGLDGAFQEYAEHAAGSLGAPEAFAPSLPTLTRYKKDVVEGARRAFEAEKASARAKGPRAWWGDFDENAPWGEGPERERLRDPATAVGTVPNDEEAGVPGGDGVRATLPQLCARVASLHFLARKLAALEREVPARFARMQRSQGVGETFVPGDGGGRRRVRQLRPHQPVRAEEAGRLVRRPAGRRAPDAVQLLAQSRGLHRVQGGVLGPAPAFHRGALPRRRRGGGTRGRRRRAPGSRALGNRRAPARRGGARGTAVRYERKRGRRVLRLRARRGGPRASARHHPGVHVGDARRRRRARLRRNRRGGAGGGSVLFPRPVRRRRRGRPRADGGRGDAPRRPAPDGHVAGHADALRRVPGAGGRGPKPGGPRRRGRARRVAGRRRDRRRAGRRRRVRRQHPAPRAVPPRGPRGEQVPQGALPPPQGGRGERDEHRQGEGQQRRGVLREKGQRRAKRRRVTRRAERRAFTEEQRI
jgi:hypothetical protein